MSQIIKYFEYEHLPLNLQEVVKPVGELVRLMDTVLPECAEKSAGLRKLLEAKDCFMRASVTPAENPPMDEVCDAVKEGFRERGSVFNQLRRGV